jgi:phosphoglycerate dehydrogenase-like enzyme
VEVAYHNTRPQSEDEKLERARDATVILNTRGIVRWPEDSLRALPKLKLIACCSIGVDCVDLKTARELGITICNVPGRTATIVAEHALAMLLGAARRLAYMTSEMKSGRWPTRQLIYLSGRRLGVIGTGNIGCEMIRMARGLGLEVVAWSMNPDLQKAARLGFRYVEFDELLRTSDAISIHLKLTEESRRLVDRAALAKMKEGALLVNTARGAIVDHAALVDALNSGHLGGAALDVFETEPIAPNDPILSCEQVILTPHVADHMPEALDLLSGGAVDNVLAFLAGRPQNVVG